jgi:hypothetical protein
LALSLPLALAAPTRMNHIYPKFGLFYWLLCVAGKDSEAIPFYPKRDNEVEAIPFYPKRHNEAEAIPFYPWK